MLKKLVLLLACASAGWSTAFAQRDGGDIRNPEERLEHIQYGLIDVCLQAQRHGQALSDYEKDNRKKLTINRMRVVNTTQKAMWSVKKDSNVAVIEDGAGCTVSSSFWEKYRDEIVPDLRSFLTSSSSAYQVIAGDPADENSDLHVGFCIKFASGFVGGVHYYEWYGDYVENRELGRLKKRQLYLSLVVPPESFCPQQ